MDARGFGISVDLLLSIVKVQAQKMRLKMGDYLLKILIHHDYSIKNENIFIGKL